MSLTQPRPSMNARPASPTVVYESPTGPVPVLVHDEWVSRWPWLLQGTTTSGLTASSRRGPPFDLGLFSGGSPEAAVRDSWRALAETVGVDTLVHASQPHGSEVRLWSRASGSDGRPAVPCLVAPCDGHATRLPGVVLAVTVADCVPVFLVDESAPAVSMVHAGWRGAAAGILETALETMHHHFGTRPEDVWVHLGPSICGVCYEVGPEVHAALGQPTPDGPEPVDLKAALACRAGAAGVRPDRLTASGHCTLCGDAGLFSHRGGDPQRQAGFLGIRS